MPEKPQLRRRPVAAGSWVRSLQCKSMAVVEDVAAARGAAVPSRKLHPLLPRSSCATTGDARKDVAPSSKPNKPGSDLSRKKKAGSNSKPGPKPPVKKKQTKPSASVPPSPPPPGPLGPVPALTELPAGHSSRQVVEIIFLSSWSPLGALAAFPGEVEMLFRVHNPARAVARFEEYRAAVRARAGGASPRSAADGNEMTRFAPAPPPHGVADDSDATSGEDAAVRVVRTFDGSGGAHASACGGPASGRRAMFLCRVIAGRVAAAPRTDSVPGKGYDSIRVGKGELVVFDRRAVLPCFLIIYKL